MPDQLEPLEIFQKRYGPAAEHFQPLFGIRLVTIGEIADRALRSILKHERNEDVVSTVPAGVIQVARMNFNHRCFGNVRKEIDEMTALADDASAALLGIVYPVVRKNVSSVDAIVHRKRLVNGCQKSFHAHSHRSEATIEPDHEKRP